MNVRRVLATITVAMLAVMFTAPATASAAIAGSASKACLSSLQNLGDVQPKRLAPAALLNASLKACATTNTSVPSAQFMTVTYKERSVGGMFIVVMDSLARMDGNDNVTSLLMNGHTLKKYKQNDKYLLEGKPVTVKTSSGKTLNATMFASIGDGGTTIQLTFPNGTFGPSDSTAAGTATTPPAKGAPVLVYAETGPVSTTMGPAYEKKWDSVNSPKRGSVTLADGSPVGWAISFGTGYGSQKEADFWEKRSYVVPAYIVNG